MCAIMLKAAAEKRRRQGMARLHVQHAHLHHWDRALPRLGHESGRRCIWQEPIHATQFHLLLRRQLCLQPILELIACVGMSAIGLSAQGHVQKQRLT